MLFIEHCMYTYVYYNIQIDLTNNICIEQCTLYNKIYFGNLVSTKLSKLEYLADDVLCRILCKMLVFNM